MTNENEYMERSLDKIASRLISFKHEIEGTAHYLHTLVAHTEAMIDELTINADCDAIKEPLSCERMTKASLLLRMLSDVVNINDVVMPCCRRDLELLQAWRKHEDKRTCTND